MSDDACSCGGAADAQFDDRTDATDRWIETRPVVEAPLPEDVAEVMSRFYGGEIRTLGEFVAATRAGAGGSVDVEDLCHVDGETPHVARTGDETYYFRCFYDGVVLSSLVEVPVEIETESPAGRTVELSVTPDGDIEVAPSGAAMSLGIARDAAASVDGDPSVEDVYEQGCPYVKAFPSKERYETWAATVDGETVGLSLADGLPIAAALAE